MLSYQCPPFLDRLSWLFCTMKINCSPILVKMCILEHLRDKANPSFRSKTTIEKCVSNGLIVYEIDDESTPERHFFRFPSPLHAKYVWIIRLCPYSWKKEWLANWYGTDGRSGITRSRLVFTQENYRLRREIEIFCTCFWSNTYGEELGLRGIISVHRRCWRALCYKLYNRVIEDVERGFCLSC